MCEDCNNCGEPIVKVPQDGKRHIGAEMRMISNLIRRRFNSTLNSEDEAISGSNGWILGYLVQNDGRDVFQRDLEEEFHVRRATVSKTICLMVQKGLIERQSVPSDARLKKLVITEKGRRLNAEIIERFDAIERDVVKDIPPDKLENFFEVCDMIVKNLSETEEKGI